MTDFSRPDGRPTDALRPIQFEAGIAANATGSVLVSFGNTKVICGAMLEKKVPGWMRAQGVTGGWLTAEYSMLPYSTQERKQRDSSRGKQDGRSVEIQRLIGRSLRAALDLEKLPEHTLWVDCDVLQADGGTRTASITGAYLAARLAVDKLLVDKTLSENPFRDSVAAVSVGVYNGTPVLDLPYEEDRDASVDFNVVMTGGGEFVELQGSGEEATFTEAELAALIALAKKGLWELSSMQKEFLARHLHAGENGESSSS